jgi:hypothetical protein
MGNLKETLKRNQHLESQNRGLLDAMRRRRIQAEAKEAQTTEALKQIESIYSSYIGALCLQNEMREVKILHANVKAVLEGYDVVAIGNDDQGVTFGLKEKENKG